MIYFKQILLVFLVVILQKVASQPSINSIDSADFMVNLPEKPKYTGYSKLEYLKDSIKNKLVHDSLIKLYSRFDSLPNKLYPKENFPFYKNIEFKKQNNITRQNH